MPTDDALAHGHHQAQGADLHGSKARPRAGAWAGDEGVDIRVLDVVHPAAVADTAVDGQDDDPPRLLRHRVGRISGRSPVADLLGQHRAARRYPR